VGEEDVSVVSVLDPPTGKVVEPAAETTSPEQTSGFMSTGVVMVAIPGASIGEPESGMFVLCQKRSCCRQIVGKNETVYVLN
jgi:hypothetical protein